MNVGDMGFGGAWIWIVSRQRNVINYVLFRWQFVGWRECGNIWLWPLVRSKVDFEWVSFKKNDSPLVDSTKGRTVKNNKISSEMKNKLWWPSQFIRFNSASALSIPSTSSKWRQLWGINAFAPAYHHRDIHSSKSTEIQIIPHESQMNITNNVDDDCATWKYLAKSRVKSLSRKSVDCFCICVLPASRPVCVCVWAFTFLCDISISTQNWFSFVKTTTTAATWRTRKKAARWKLPTVRNCVNVNGHLWTHSTITREWNRRTKKEEEEVKKPSRNREFIDRECRFAGNEKKNRHRTWTSTATTPTRHHSGWGCCPGWSLDDFCITQ